jgi:hypothetical protein
MKVNPANFFLFVLISLLILSSCSKPIKPAHLAGSYLGNERIIFRFDKGGQYIYKEDRASVSLIIDDSGNVTGMVGEATFDGCKLSSNRGWIARQLDIKTDFIIIGTLIGGISEKDTITRKNISIPFNLKNGQITGNLFLIEKGSNYPLINSLKLQLFKN